MICPWCNWVGEGVYNNGKIFAPTAMREENSQFLESIIKRIKEEIEWIVFLFGWRNGGRRGGGGQNSLISPMTLRMALRDSWRVADGCSSRYSLFYFIGPLRVSE